MAFESRLLRWDGPGAWYRRSRTARHPRRPVPSVASRVTATVDGRTWSTSVWHDRARGWLLPVPARVRGEKDDGDLVVQPVEVDASRLWGRGLPVGSLAGLGFRPRHGRDRRDPGGDVAGRRRPRPATRFVQPFAGGRARGTPRSGTGRSTPPPASATVRWASRPWSSSPLRPKGGRPRPRPHHVRRPGHRVAGAPRRIGPARGHVVPVRRGGTAGAAARRVGPHRSGHARAPLLGPPRPRGAP